MRNMSGTAKDIANSGIGEGATASIGSEGAAANANTTTALFSPPGTDLRMDWGDACSLGCLPDFNRYGDCFVEGTYLYSDSATPCIWMFSIALQRKIKVQHFISSSPIPFQRPVMSYAQYVNIYGRNV